MPPAAALNRARHPTKISVEALEEAATLSASLRGTALNCGMLAVLWASAEAGERAAYADEFLTERQGFLAAIRRNRERCPFVADIAEVAADRERVHAFRIALEALPDDRVDFTLQDARALAHQARKDAVPAMSGMMAHLGSMANAAREDDSRAMSDKAALVDGMLAEMSRIGRTIGLIAINASVEAARAGGASGRTFQVIATEVRDLAQQSADLLEQTKIRLTEDAARRIQ